MPRNYKTELGNRAEILVPLEVVNQFVAQQDLENSEPAFGFIDGFEHDGKKIASAVFLP